jgi:predicted MFS family arabinose efflux permease
LFAGILGIISWALLGQWPGFYYVFPILLAFGLAFVLLQSTIIFTAQQQLPLQRGAVMSLCSFNMFIGGGLGVSVNRFLLSGWGYEVIFSVAALAIMAVGILSYRLLLRLAQQPA